MASVEDRRSRGFVTMRLRSFGHALRGLVRLTRETNARIHALATVVVLWAGYFLQLAALEWALIAFAIGLVLSAEALNTAVESLADAAVPEPHPLVGAAKDLGAAAVLIAALAAVAIAALVLGPHLVTLSRELR
ncbi:MAG TPA: diacylglycerol kinase family protein [Polyangiaceae bacterium]|nr:diacylglycerol kinase family protein [Polyangiaceae bacterium]